MTKAASSANKTQPNDKDSNISLINKMNNRGPRTLPWGTPHKTESISEFRSPLLTYCFPPLKYDCSRPSTSFLIP